MKKAISRLLVVIIILSATIAIDQGTKLAARGLEGRGTVPVLGSFFVLVYAENRGAFLSLGAGMSDVLRPILLYFLPLAAIIAALAYLIVKLKELTLGTTIALSMFIGGGIGNLVDRLLYNGYVVDFMNFGIGTFRITGVLNFADLFLTAGVIMFVITAGRKESK